ncbi:MAG: hypothetical protein U0Z44_09540 [Kouleothrix sp.]
MAELQDADERVQMGGPERRSRVMTERWKLLVAYHEAGHGAGSGRYAQIVPGAEGHDRAAAGTGGYTLYLPEEEACATPPCRSSRPGSCRRGGRLTEEIAFGARRG